MNSLSSDLLHYRDVVFVVGQSNCGPYGDDLTMWPEREQHDRNWGQQNYSIDDDWHSGEVYPPGQNGTGLPCGYLADSLAAQMRYLGLKPSISTISRGGISSADLLAEVLAIWANYIVAEFLKQINPRSVSLVWSQGESMLYDGLAATWGADTSASVAKIRQALSMPQLHLTVIQLAKVYTPSPPTIYLAAARAAQSAMVAGETDASIVCVDSVVTVTSNIHIDQIGLNKQARLVAHDIKSRII